jgi:hypothetical protein
VHVEHAAFSGQQLDGIDGLFVFLENARRQTDGV